MLQEYPPVSSRYSSGYPPTTPESRGQLFPLHICALASVCTVQVRTFPTVHYIILPATKFLMRTTAGLFLNQPPFTQPLTELLERMWLANDGGAFLHMPDPDIIRAAAARMRSTSH